ncbi:EAL domain-containing protein, partial [Xanthomonas citri pv. citri]|nr:EAL domain-containing protein [Xanthomonas citri pv. citri]
KEEYDIPDGLLELEFTENIFFENVARLNLTVDRLKRAGFHCSIDDFGAGYSSLNMLKDLSVDALKLDGGFFRFAKDDERART